jgi:hypothetical protein
MKNIKSLIIIILMIILYKPIEAQIVYTDISDTTIFIPNVENVDTTNRYEFDLNNDGTNDFRFLATNIYFNNKSLITGKALDISYIFNNNKVAGGCQGYTIYTINAGDTISNILSWDIVQYIKFTQTLVPWECTVPIGDVFFGLKLLVNTDTLYGWVRCCANDTSITIKDYAYNSSPNTYILAGQTIDGIKELHITLNHTISPNPFTTTTQITLNQTYHNIALAVYDIQGKLLAQNRYKDCSQIQLNRNQLSNGLYFLKLTMDDMEVETGKIVIRE